MYDIRNYVDQGGKEGLGGKNLLNSGVFLACENIRFSSLFATGDVLCGEEPGETDIFAGKGCFIAELDFELSFFLGE